jgi:hypothetical protein
MNAAQAVALLTEYAPYLKTTGTLIVIVPGPRGFRSDPTHVEFMDYAKVKWIAEQAGFTTLRQYSFPFPYWLGNFFTHNDNLTIARPQLLQ